MIPIIDINNKEGKDRLDKVLSRTQLDMPGVRAVVDEIVKDVRENGDKALFSYVKKFDRAELTELKVSQAEIDEALKNVGSELASVIERAAERITIFHEKQKTKGWLEPFAGGEIMGQLARPLDSVGVYVPGGKAAYPSSVLMNVIPAVVAGVKRIVMITPPKPDGTVDENVLVAAVKAGVTEIYKSGGASAVAALAFGTKTIPRVDKIVGPGNIYVALAKRSVYGYADIDSVAGPSEILIVADETANPSFVAADLLSQAEHDEMASAVCVVTNKKLAEKIAEEVETQTNKLERKEIIEKSLADYGAVIVAENLEQAVDLANQLAPEHLELCVNDPFSILGAVKNAGAIFMGHYTPEPLGDYLAGPNHVLPTGGTARFFSPLSVDDFIKKTSVLYFGKDSLAPLAKDAISFAEAEGFTAHANSIRIRL